MRDGVENRIAADFIRKVEAGFAENPELQFGPLKTEWGTLRLSWATNRPRLLIDDSMGTREVAGLPGLLKTGIAKTLGENLSLSSDLETALKLSDSPLAIEKLKLEAKVIPFPKNDLKAF